MHPYFQLFSFQVPAYGLMVTLGILAAMIMGRFLRKHLVISEDDYYSAIIWLLVSGLIGSKLLYWIVEFDEVIKNPHFLIESLTAGFVYYGAFLGAVIGIFICTKIRKQSFLSYMDMLCPPIALGQAIGRIGCYLAGCCYGAPTSSACGVIFPANVGSSAPAGIPLIPTQLYESAFCLLLSGFLVFIFLREKRAGTSLGYYCVLYSIWRFIIEFYRSDDRGTVGALSTSQFICIFLFLIGVVLLYLAFKNRLPVIQRYPSDEIVMEASDASDETEIQETDIPQENCVATGPGQTQDTDTVSEEKE